MSIKFERRETGTYDVIYVNGVNLGELYVEIDGYYVYWPSPRNGFWESHAMREIADKLDELNADWDRSIHEFFEAQENKETENG